MNQSSSYKHLTVILAALLTTIVIAIVALVILLSSGPAETPDDPVTDGVSDTIPDRDNSSADPGTTPTPSTTPTVPSVDSTTAPTTSGNGQITTEAPTTEAPPVTEAPDDTPIGPINGSAYGDKLGALELYAEWKTVSYDPVTGNCTLKLDLYCDSYSISLGPRFENYLVINNDRFEFRTEKISIPTNDHKTRTLLYSTEYEIQKDSPTERFPVTIEFGWHYQGRYSGEHAEWLTLKTKFVV